jgi:predicted RNase H-like HicB family nuclease
MSGERNANATTATIRATDLHYTLIIEWDPRDAIYVATVPELPGCRTHGRTYGEAIEQVQEAIESWVEVALADGEQLPDPRIFTDWSNYPADDAVPIPDVAITTR